MRATNIRQLLAAIWADPKGRRWLLRSQALLVGMLAFDLLIAQAIQSIVNNGILAGDINSVIRGAMWMPRPPEKSSCSHPARNTGRCMNRSSGPGACRGRDTRADARDDGLSADASPSTVSVSRPSREHPYSMRSRLCSSNAACSAEPLRPTSPSVPIPETESTCPPRHEPPKRPASSRTDPTDIKARSTTRRAVYASSHDGPGLRAR
jgi:hypothetical protein